MTPMGRMQQAAQDFNLDARFGRNELAIEHVAPSAREEFGARHREWGNMVRVADVELTGIQSRGDNEADVLVRIAWYSLKEDDLRLTMVKQTWRDAGGWKLVAEQRTEGDAGLFGETVVRQTPPARSPAQFPTITLGGSRESSE